MQDENLKKKGDYQLRIWKFEIIIEKNHLNFHKISMHSLMTMSSLTQTLRLHKVNVSLFEIVNTHNDKQERTSPARGASLHEAGTITGEHNNDAFNPEQETYNGNVSGKFRK